MKKKNKTKMDGPRVYHGDWNKSDEDKHYIVSNRNKLTDTENWWLPEEGGGEDGWNRWRRLKGTNF